VPTPLVLVKRTALASALALAVVYLGDTACVGLRTMHPRANDPFESLTAPRILAIPENNGKIAFESDVQQPDQTITCVHSLFPHSGFSPCWYVKKHLQQPIPMIQFLHTPSPLA
jgi:hypothetical protein